MDVIVIVKRNILLGIAWISLILGGIGIFLPLLPTTPFILLSAFCFQKSSERFHQWILNSPIFGKYIRDYQEQKGITLKNKIVAVTFMALGMSFSAYKVPNTYMRISLLVIFIAVSYHIFKIKTLKK
ncbi:YbaN family protein [Fusobacterium necrophorum]|uniref:PF04304 family protein n=2 Tax=Fusobacterium necrophorum TaxID=859 RepID=A0AAN4ATS1_9FUSO|nr:YbaN family protein [Fusobacterium necrophorum]EJU18709.1 PF04304 family protein [Fusobacterium necrophorum subsp. funduliforme Fnf 1007]MDK4511944.1 YbaN family protein [Fusobacterium necrophorum]MDK4519136.1 YbaN family protein [Fusobacterium necrophorum]